MITSCSAAARRGRAVGVGRQGAQAALLDVGVPGVHRLLGHAKAAGLRPEE
jgi:NCAIR mutase (PurE)-related protein